jgi:hypothetical protein
MNDEMYLELHPSNGFYDWEELRRIERALKRLGWDTQIIAILGGFKINFKKKLEKQQEKNND